MPERGPTRKAPCYYFNDTVRFTSEQIPSHTNIFLLGQRLMVNGAHPSRSLDKFCARSLHLKHPVKSYYRRTISDLVYDEKVLQF